MKTMKLSSAAYKFAVQQPGKSACIVATALRRFGLAVALTLLPLSGHAAVTSKDIEVAGRVLGFTTNPLAGTVKLGIIYDPANPDSTAEARTLAGIIGSGLTINNITLVAVPISIQNVASVKSDLMFMTSGLGTGDAKAGAEATSEKILCITTDLAATQAGDCAVSVQTTPNVQITINKATAEASGIDFVSAFMLMITEI